MAGDVVRIVLNHKRLVNCRGVVATFPSKTWLSGESPMGAFVGVGPWGMSVPGVARLICQTDTFVTAWW